MLRCTCGGFGLNRTREQPFQGCVHRFREFLWCIVLHGCHGSTVEIDAVSSGSIIYNGKLAVIEQHFCVFSV